MHAQGLRLRSSKRTSPLESETSAHVQRSEHPFFSEESSTSTTTHQLAQKTCKPLASTTERQLELHQTASQSPNKFHSKLGCEQPYAQKVFAAPQSPIVLFLSMFDVKCGSLLHCARWRWKLRCAWTETWVTLFKENERKTNKTHDHLFKQQLSFSFVSV